jgi:hypothetical protein
MALAQTQSTYTKHVAETTAYGWAPMPYETWLAWRVNKPIKMLTEQDKLNHPKES